MLNRSTERSAPTRVDYGRAPQQFCELRVPDGDGPHPVVVFIHGGFWRNRYELDLADPQVADSVDSGFAAFNVEYRRVGDPGGGFPGTLADVAAAVDQLPKLAEEFRLDLDAVAIVGHSAGGHLALWTGQRGRIPAGAVGADPVLTPAIVVGQAPVSDLTAAALSGMGTGAVIDFMGGGPDKRVGDYAVADPARLLPVEVPQLIVHGTADDDVPIGASRDYVASAALQGGRVELIEFDGADHFDMIDPAHDSWTVVKQRLSRLRSG